jgi:hypothetical protein
MKQHSEGYVVLAQNNSSTDYVQCARVLAKSLRLIKDTRPITLITDQENENLDIFDNVVILKSTTTKDQWRLADDSQVYDLSPYDRTFKIESDVIVTRSLDNWWELCSNRDVLVATGALDYHQRETQSRYYRQIIDKNKLPDVYNGLTYFNKSEFSKQFFTMVKTVFENWTEINTHLMCPSPLEFADTDTVYAIVCKLMNTELTTLPGSPIKWTHMKSKINQTGEDWTQDLVWELVDCDFRINTISQLYPVHYHVKKLAATLENYYDRKLSNK